eukprot:CAMPEP_0170550594 /NCGR_PEP_ID=MMETSP0211-20121228/8638_1 /TAXON_ID=311385 /ORGANISM="Pseudokeronopsis sp., Strain OXSARD2" /LENGTH=88 /DNA_ID=CAMNT_0010857225 /DNA_START=253 /DNA_END=519 /DNA_ORIENTATION=+
MTRIYNDSHERIYDIGFLHHMHYEVLVLYVAGEVEDYANEQVSELLFDAVFGLPLHHLFQLYHHKWEHIVLFHFFSDLLYALLISCEV